MTSQSPSPVVSPKPTTTKVSFKDRIASELHLKKEATHPPPITCSLPPPLIKSPPPKACSPVPEQDFENSSPETPLLSAHEEEIKSEAKISEVDPIVDPVNDEVCNWTKLKQAAIVRDSVSSGSGDTNLDSDSITSLKKFPKPNLLEFHEKSDSRTKTYKSIDDLSPEYSGLPFVKKLKILNERQKLAELEHVMKARSVSLDLPSENGQNIQDTITRSRSEATSMHSCNILDIAPDEVPPTSPESNETLGK